jgi:hypothetical protein
MTRSSSGSSIIKIILTDHYTRSATHFRAGENKILVGPGCSKEFTNCPPPLLLPPLPPPPLWTNVPCRFVFINQYLLCMFFSVAFQFQT